MKRNELPDRCFPVLPSTGQFIILKNGEKGYYPAEWDTKSRAEWSTLLRWEIFATERKRNFGTNCGEKGKGEVNRPCQADFN